MSLRVSCPGVRAQWPLATGEWRGVVSALQVLGEWEEGLTNCSSVEGVPCQKHNHPKLHHTATPTNGRGKLTCEPCSLLLMWLARPPPFPPFSVSLRVTEREAGEGGATGEEF